MNFYCDNNSNLDCLLDMQDYLETMGTQLMEKTPKDLENKVNRIQLTQRKQYLQKMQMNKKNIFELLTQNYYF